MDLLHRFHPLRPAPLHSGPFHRTSCSANRDLGQVREGLTHLTQHLNGGSPFGRVAYITGSFWNSPGCIPGRSHFRQLLGKMLIQSNILKTYTAQAGKIILPISRQSPHALELGNRKYGMGRPVFFNILQTSAALNSSCSHTQPLLAQAATAASCQQNGC